MILYDQELRHLFMDAMGAVEARNISNIALYDCSGASTAIMGIIECRLS